MHTKRFAWKKVGVCLTAGLVALSAAAVLKAQDAQETGFIRISDAPPPRPLDVPPAPEGEAAPPVPQGLAPAPDSGPNGQAASNNGAQPNACPPANGAYCGAYQCPTGTCSSQRCDSHHKNIVCIYPLRELFHCDHWGDCCDDTGFLNCLEDSSIVRWWQGQTAMYYARSRYSSDQLCDSVNPRRLTRCHSCEPVSQGYYVVDRSGQHLVGGTTHHAARQPAPGRRVATVGRQPSNIQTVAYHHSANATPTHVAAACPPAANGPHPSSVVPGRHPRAHVCPVGSTGVESAKPCPTAGCATGVCCKLGYLIPSGGNGSGVYPAGAYNLFYPNNPYYFDERDGKVYAAQGYGVPVTVPLAPNVHYAYNYSWGIPSSRLTPIFRPTP
jgi:hypothetical protein